MDADDLSRYLDDPRGLCEALSLLDGPRGKTWTATTGRGVMLVCPWHGDRTPSLSVFRGEGNAIRVFCHGCGAKGDAFTLIAHVHGLDVRRDFRDVVDLACDLAGLPRPERPEFTPRPPPVRVAPRAPAPPPVEQPDDGALAAVAAVLASVAPVRGSREGMDYLRARGLDGTEAEGWYALPTGAARDRIVDACVEAMGREAWGRSGLASESGWWSGSWPGLRLVIPWRSPDGEVDCLQGRYIGADAKVNRFAFPGGRSPRWPYGSDALSEVGHDTAVALTEGAIDAASFNALARRAGADVVALALPSVTAWDARWFRVLAGRPLISALDNDEAGRKHTPGMVERLRAVARRGAVTVRVPSGPEGAKDWNDVLRSRVTAAAKTEAA